MVSLIEAIILSVVQGITEWLPVSSSGHLALFQVFFGFQNLSFDVFLHFASILAVIILFRKDLLKLMDLKDKNNIKYILMILIGIIPAGIFGLLFKDQIEGYFASLYYLGIFFIISGILIFSTKFTKERKQDIGYIDSLVIGIFQMIAIVPGISRSGATISGGMFRGIKKETAVKFSFFLAIPVILGASILEFKNLMTSDIDLSLLVISFIVTFIVSIITIKLLMKIIKSDKFYLFGIYDIILGVLVLMKVAFM